MKILFRAVVSGFGFSLGAAIYKKVSKRLGLDEEDKDKAAKAAATDRNADGAVDPPDDATDADDAQSVH